MVLFDVRKGSPSHQLLFDNFVGGPELIAPKQAGLVRAAWVCLPGWRWTSSSIPRTLIRRRDLS